jgi:diacylglycerol O-acyltransferase
MDPMENRIMSQLSPLDGVFLSMETPETPAQIGGLAILETSTASQFDFTGFRDFVAERVALCPRFTWRIKQVPFGLDLPYWVDDETLDFTKHVHRIALPAPGGQHELAALSGHLFSVPLDRSRPLWEMYFIEGLQGGRAALLWKVHHCLMDGVSGAGLVELLFDSEPTPSKRKVNPSELEEAPTKPPSFGRMLRRSMRNASKRNVKFSQNLINAAAASLASRDRDSGASNEVPRASFNGIVGARREVAWSSVPLEHLKDIKNQLEVTLNDVILGITGGAVRRYLGDQGSLPDDGLSAIIPMSVRAEGDKTIGNQVQEIAVDWATDVADPVERILRINRGTKVAKRDVAAGVPNIIGGLAESFPPAMTSLITRFGAAFADRIPLPGNAVVSNVRMPDYPLYIAGAKIASMIPMSVLAPTQGLNITAITYCGEVYFGVTADPRLVPDPWQLSDAIAKSLILLQASAEEWSSQVG